MNRPATVPRIIAGTVQRYSGRLLTRFRISQVLEELAIGLEQHDVATIGKRLLIGIQTTREGVKLRITVKESA